MAVEFIGGDDVIVTFRLENADGSVADLTGCTVTVGVWWWGSERFVLEEGEGVAISAALPAGEDDPHGTISLTEAQSAQVPVGDDQDAKLMIHVYRTSDDLTTSSDLYALERLA